MAATFSTDSADSACETDEYSGLDGVRSLCVFDAFNELTDETDEEGQLLRNVIEHVISNDDTHTPPHIVLFKTFVVYRAFVKRMMLSAAGGDGAADRIAALDRFLERLH